MNWQIKTGLVIVFMMITMTTAPVFFDSSHLGAHFVNIALHSSLEAIASFASILMGMFFLFLPSQDSKLNHNALAAGFISMGFLEGLHSFIAIGNSFIFIFSFASLMGSLGYIFALFPKEKFPFFYTKTCNIIFVSFSVVAGLFAIIFDEYLPVMSGEDTFTIFASSINIASGLLSIIAAFIIHFRFNNPMNLEQSLLVVIALLFGVSGLTFNYSHLWCTVWWYWHIIRVLAFFILPIIAIINIKKLHMLLNDQLGEITRINEQLENYSYTISHDLKEPIRSIRNFSQFIEEDYSEDFDEDGKDYLQRIIKASDRMACMIDDLLSLSRVGKTNTTFTKVDLNNLLLETKDLLKLKLEEQNVSFNIENLPELCCQEVWMKSVFLNLISNAVKYNDKRNPHITISCTSLDNHYEFAIEDNGQGIEEDQIKNVFKLFRKAHQDRNIEGSGAGLTITESVIKQHQGKIWIDKTAVGVGTTVKFTISKNLCTMKK